MLSVFLVRSVSALRHLLCHLLSAYWVHSAFPIVFSTHPAIDYNPHIYIYAYCNSSLVLHVTTYIEHRLSVTSRC